MGSDLTASAAHQAVLPPQRLRLDVWRAFRAEWGKAFSVRATMSCLAAALVTALVTAAGLANDFTLTVRNGQQPPFAVVDSMDILGQAMQLGVVVAGAGLMLLVTGEYSSGAATATFTAQPRRATVLCAKAAVAALVGAGAGVVTGGATTIVTSVILGEHAAPSGPGIAEVTVRAGVLWACLALFIVALATVLRSAVGTLAALVVILLGLWAVPDPVGRFLPGQAALSFSPSRTRHTPPWSDWCWSLAGALGELAGEAGLSLYVRILDTLELSEVTVIDNSIGGWIAAEIALLGSPRVSAVVLSTP